MPDRSAQNPDTGMESIRLIGFDSKVEQELVAAVSAPPRLKRAMDEAATLEIEIDNHSRKFQPFKSYAVVRGLRFVFARWEKTGHYANLTFEDAVVNKLRHRLGKRVWNAGEVTIQRVVKDIATDADVMVTIDPRDMGKINNVVEKKEEDNSWDLLKSLASERNWRCFSDGWQVFFGTDEWLATLTPPATLREPAPGEPQGENPVHNIDFSADTGTPADTATMTVDAETWALPPGRSVTLGELGWGDGVWLVESFERTLTSPQGTVELSRRRVPLPEPPPTSVKDADPGEAGFNTSDESLANIDSDLARLRQCEATGDYKANTGNGYYGAYQFDKKTWQGLGYSGLPHQATPATQDEAAIKLYQKKGWAPWPACSKKLGLVDKRGQNTAANNGGNSKLADIAIKMAKASPKYIWGGKTARGYDCSGFVAEATKRAGKQLSGGSKEQKANAQRAGKLISVEEGLRTSGAILFRMSGEPTHVAISLGNGSTVEARGTADGTGVFGGAAKRKWTHAALWI
jgi:cell wall-associated NlpC family hydrolase